jgi:hypothetical protein
MWHGALLWTLKYGYENKKYWTDDKSVNNEFTGKYYWKE